MPGAALLQAINRLDHAIGRAESAYAALAAKTQHPTGHASPQRDESVRRALAELDALIADLKGGPHG